MNCKQCNNPQAENELFCKNCGHQGPLDEQQQKVAEIRNKVDTLLLTQCKSVMFLIVTICFTVMTVAQVINMVSGGIMGILGGILPAIFMIIATVGLWKSYLAKEKSALASSLKSASIFDQYNNVMYSISIVLLVLGMIGAMAVVGMGGAALGEMGESDVSGGIIGAIIGIGVGFLIPIIIISLFQRIYVNRRKYFVELSQYAAGGNYTAEKAPIFGSFVLGGGSFIGGIFSLFATTIITAMLGAVMGALGDMAGEMAGELEGVMDMIQPMLDTMAASAVITGLSNLIYGGYYVVSALWMSKTHKEVLAASEEMNRENAKLSDLEARTRAAVTAYQTEQAVAQKKEREAAEAEAKKAQAAFQEQQNAMMQMMMQQMMANGMMNANAAAPAAPVAETPAEEAPVEETPVEEAPVEETPVEESPVEEAPVEE